MVQNLHIKLLFLIVFILSINFIIFVFYIIKVDGNYKDLKQQLTSLEKDVSKNNTLQAITKPHVKPTRIKPQKPVNTKLSNFLFDSNTYFGSSKPPSVFVIEFSNFKCGYCAKHHESVFKQIKKNYIDTDKIRYYVFTTTNINDKNSVMLSKLYSCNTAPVKLDEFIHELFSIAKNDYHNIDKINVNSLLKFSNDKEEYLKCINSQELDHSTLILNQHLSSLNIDRTPTFLIGRFSDKNNYKRLIGSLPYNSFSSEIERLLNDKTK